MWHQDLVGNGTTAATIVLNIDSIVAGDELNQIEQIRNSHRLMEAVLVNTVSVALIIYNSGLHIIGPGK